MPLWTFVLWWHRERHRDKSVSWDLIRFTHDCRSCPAATVPAACAHSRRARASPPTCDTCRRYRPLRVVVRTPRSIPGATFDEPAVHLDSTPIRIAHMASGHDADLRVRHVARQPLAMSRRNEHVFRAVPDGCRHVKCRKVESPWLDECQFVVDPSPHTVARDFSHFLLDVRREVLSRHHSLVGLGKVIAIEKAFRVSSHASAHLRVLTKQFLMQLAFAFECPAELSHVQRVHAIEPSLP